MDNDLFEMKELHDFQTAPLYGIVFNSNNKPCSGAEISVYVPDTDKVIYALSSDINGRFMIPELMKGKHEVRIEKPGFESGKILFDFSDATKVLYMKLTSLQSLLESAETHIDKRNFNEAETDLDRALRIDPGSIETLYLQAVLYSLDGKEELAEEKIQAIRVIDPDFVMNR